MTFKDNIFNIIEIAFMNRINEREISNLILLVNSQLYTNKSVASRALFICNTNRLNSALFLYYVEKMKTKLNNWAMVGYKIQQLEQGQLNR